MERRVRAEDMASAARTIRSHNFAINRSMKIGNSDKSKKSAQEPSISMVTTARANPELPVVTATQQEIAVSKDCPLRSRLLLAMRRAVTPTTSRKRSAMWPSLSPLGVPQDVLRLNPGVLLLTLLLRMTVRLAAKSRQTSLRFLPSWLSRAWRSRLTSWRDMELPILLILFLVRQATCLLCRSPTSTALATSPWLTGSLTPNSRSFSLSRRMRFRVVGITLLLRYRVNTIDAPSHRRCATGTAF